MQFSTQILYLVGILQIFFLPQTAAAGPKVFKIQFILHIYFFFDQRKSTHAIHQSLIWVLPNTKEPTNKKN